VVWVKDYTGIAIDTSVIVQKLIVSYKGGYIRWTKGASINGVSHENFRVY
jgi:hypothetical protein